MTAIGLFGQPTRSYFESSCCQPVSPGPSRLVFPPSWLTDVVAVVEIPLLLLQRGSHLRRARLRPARLRPAAVETSSLETQLISALDNTNCLYCLSL